MKHAFFALLVGLAATSGAMAHSFTSPTIYVDHPAIQEAPPSAPVLGGYAMFSNNGPEDDRLIAIESPAMEKVELHISVVTDGVARMSPMVDGLLIPAGATVWLGDAGSHAMFIKPDKRYVDGDEIPAALVFEKAGRIDVTFMVERGSRDEIGRGHGEHGADNDQ
jgi:copper(I)-binding protein